MYLSILTWKNSCVCMYVMLSDHISNMTVCCLMPSRVCVTGHIKDPVPLIGKSRDSYLGGRFHPPSFIQVIIITGLNKLHNCMFSS